MSENQTQEREVKFYIANLNEVEARLVSLGARLAQPRVHETNLRFDTPNNELSLSYQALRLRKDTAARITYKGPGELQDGVRVRQELEFVVSDFDMAQAFLQALGYHVALMYEKYRATYHLENVLVTLDEMPYGFFMEIEGPDGASIQTAAQQLGLDWEKRIVDSYTTIFQHLRQKLGLTFRDLSFDNFKDMTVSAADLGVEQAA
jgi:adenylate cyclase class 2